MKVGAPFFVVWVFGCTAVPVLPIRPICTNASPPEVWIRPSAPPRMRSRLTNTAAPNKEERKKGSSDERRAEKARHDVGHNYTKCKFCII